MKRENEQMSRCDKNRSDVQNVLVVLCPNSSRMVKKYKMLESMWWREHLVIESQRRVYRKPGKMACKSSAKKCSERIHEMARVVMSNVSISKSWWPKYERQMTKKCPQQSIILHWFYIAQSMSTKHEYVRLRIFASLRHFYGKVAHIDVSRA